MPERCILLEALPPELRLRIYEHLYNEPCHCSLLMRNVAKIELINRAQTPAALIGTCRTIYMEAAPILYNTTTFRLQIYPEGGFHTHRMTVFHTANPYLGRIQHLEVKVGLLEAYLITPAMEFLQTLASALEEIDADMKTLDVDFRIFPDVADVRRHRNKYLVERACRETLRRHDDGRGVEMARRTVLSWMLKEAQITNMLYS